MTTIVTAERGEQLFTRQGLEEYITDAVISPRTGWLNALARQVHTVTSRVGFAVLGVGLVLATAWFRRFRHLVIWFISLGVAGALLQGLELLSLRTRPFGVQQLAGWEQSLITEGGK